MSDVHTEMITEAMKSDQVYSSVEVTRNTKGYNWSVKVVGLDNEKVRELLKDTEKFLQEEYGE